ncbi:hypothetical protein M2272_000326 [Mycobacterium frederiksbergense]|uniref:TonB C-terminal domain-containing protein n=1 Tax=Mycolicibacterium frederiksbergense TaxID=117567 RepID=A0ABT6KUN3_9MYCO|nr:hypothetical protein [Mycolicibacterium frederiksbergense]
MTLTSFSASRDGSLKDVELRASLAGRAGPPRHRQRVTASIVVPFVSGSSAVDAMLTMTKPAIITPTAQLPSVATRTPATNGGIAPPTMPARLNAGPAPV